MNFKSVLQDFEMANCRVLVHGLMEAQGQPSSTCSRAPEFIAEGRPESNSSSPQPQTQLPALSRSPTHLSTQLSSLPRFRSLSCACLRHSLERAWGQGGAAWSEADTWPLSQTLRVVQAVFVIFKGEENRKKTRRCQRGRGQITKVRKGSGLYLCTQTQEMRINASPQSSPSLLLWLWT